MLKFLVMIVCFFCFFSTTFWFSLSEKITLSRFIDKIGDYEKKKMVLEKLLKHFKQKNEVDFLRSLSQKEALKNLKTKKLFVSWEIEQKLQEKPLSCEVNSASLFASYFLEREIQEAFILSHIPKNEQKPLRQSAKLVWGNPYTEFVWKIHWKQTKNISKLSGYWVYAYPVSNALRQIWVPNEVKNFKKYDIVDALLQGNPVMFWYLQANIDGNIDTKPVVWYTKDGEKIEWYIWQHTWLIVWVSFFTNGEIDEVYFYEWKNLDVQVMKYKDLAYRASFFNMMIVKK